MFGWSGTSRVNWRFCKICISSHFHYLKKFRKLPIDLRVLAKLRCYEDQFVKMSRNSKQTWTLYNDIFRKHKLFCFQQNVNADGEVYSSPKLIVDELNHSFNTSAQVKFTHNGPSEILMQIWKLTFTNLSKFYAFITNHS